MKKWMTSLVLVLGSIALKAQEVAEEVAEESEGLKNYFSTETKWTLVYIFAAILIVTVLRTFRGKPEV